MARRRSNTGGINTGNTGNLNPEDILDDDGNPIATPANLEAVRSAQLEQTRRAEQQEQAAQTIQISASISEHVNARVKGLLGGMDALRKIQRMGAENDQYGTFYENHKESFGKILKMDLKGTYEALKVNAANRDKLYEDLVKKNILTKDELKALQRIVSPQPFLRYIKALGNRRVPQGSVALTPDDQETLSRVTLEDMPTLLARLKAENKITDVEERRLIELGPKSSEQLDNARNKILEQLKTHDQSAHTSFHATFLRFNENEDQLAGEFDKYIDQYNTLIQGLVEQIQAEFDEHQQNKIKDARTRQLTRESGLPIKKGQVLWGVEIINGAAGTEKNTRIEIEDITFAGVQKDPDLHEDFQILMPSFEPIIHLRTTPNGGQTEEIQLPAAQLQKWLVQNQVTEKFETQEALEQELGLAGFLKAGQVLNYKDPEKTTAPPATGEEGSDEPANDNAIDNFSSVTIVKIENGKVFLDHPVRLSPAVPGTTITSPQLSDELEFGDFARWYRKYVGVPEVVDLDELDELLEQHHQHLVAEMDWPEGHGEPLSMADGPFPQFVISAYEPERPPIEITGVNDDGLIETGSGDKIKAHDFYRAVLENGLTRPTPEQLKELQQIAEAKRNTAAQAALAAAAASPNTPPDAPSGKADADKKSPQARKSFWERAKEFWGNTQILSLMDMYELFIKAPTERIQAWLKDKSERRQYAVGKEFYKNFPKFGGLNDLSTMYEDKANGKFATDVKELEEIYEKNYIPSKVFEILYAAPNKAVLKAALQFLSKKGLLRWEDDQKLWAVMNRLLGGVTYPEKYHNDLGQGVAVIIGDMSPKKKAPTLDIFDQYRIVLDKAWGTGTFDSINGNNEREYQTKKESTGKDMHKYEYMSGGIGTMLKKMLYDWEHGVDVKQAEFDGLLSEAIDRTEVNAEQAFLLLISAFSVRNPKKGNQTMLSYSRLNPFVGKLSKHQLYFYFASNYPELDANGEEIMTVDEEGKPVPQKAKFNLNRFTKVYNEVVKKDIEASGKSGLEKFTAGKNTIDWMQREVLTNKLIKDKMAEKAGSGDIDTMYYQYLGPLIKQENLDKVIGRGWNSLGKPEVVKNMYAGYNNQLAIKASQLDRQPDKADKDTRAEEFRDMVNGVIYFNNILRNRIKRNQQYLRMTDTMFESTPLADKKRKTIAFCTEIEQFSAQLAEQVAAHTNDGELAEMSAAILRSGTGVLDDTKEQEFRDRLSQRIMELHQRNPKELAEIAQSCSTVLKGISGTQLSAEEAKEAKAA